MSLESEDRLIGLWYTNVPYDLLEIRQEEGPPQKKGSSATTQGSFYVQRTYLCDLRAIVSVKHRRNLLLQFDTSLALRSPNKTFYKNGRHYYLVAGIDNESNICNGVFEQHKVPDPFKISESFPFSPLFKLICTGFKVADVLPFLREEEPSICTAYGAKIAKSMIKIAATRIFADPEQSIVELPVNSVDSYSALRSGKRAKTVGKFGMGFFSILYWLVDHPDRFLTIESYHDNVRIYCSIMERNGELGFTLDYEDTNVSVNGTRVVLHCAADPFTDHNVQGFVQQLGKVRFLVSDLMAFRNKGSDMFQMWNRTCQDTTNRTFVQINHDGISVEDYAQGIDLHTLLTKLFVPSVSTKTIQAGSEVDEEQKAEGVLSPSWIEPNGLDTNNFVILVQSVAVVTVPFHSENKTKYNVVVTLVGNVRIPVSRDDILLSDSTIAELHGAVLPDLLRACGQLQNLAVLQRALKAYIQATTLSSNKQEFYSLLNKVSLPDKVAVQERYLPIFLETPVKPFVVSAVSTEQSGLLALLDSVSESDKSVFWNKKVFYVPASVLDGANMSTSGLSSYLFVSQEFVATHGHVWPQRLALSTYRDRLVLLGDDGTVDLFVKVEIDDKYKGFIESRVGSTPGPTVVNVLCQIALKLLAVFDMYDVFQLSEKQVSHEKPLVFTEEGFSNQEGDDLRHTFNRFSASGTFWFHDITDTTHTPQDRYLFSVLDDLIFNYQCNGPLGAEAVFHMYEVYEVLDGLVNSPNKVVYGKSKPTLQLQGVQHLGRPLSMNSLASMHLWYNSMPVTCEVVDQVLAQFPVLRGMMAEHVQLTLDASRHTVQGGDKDKFLVFWPHFNPFYTAFFALSAMENHQRRMDTFDTTLEFDQMARTSEFIEMFSFTGELYFSHFILHYLKTAPSYYMFMLVAFLCKQLTTRPDLAEEVLLTVSGETKPCFLFLFAECTSQSYKEHEDIRNRHYSHVFPLLVTFFEQFAQHNIPDVKEFLMNCLTVRESSSYYQNFNLFGYGTKLKHLENKFTVSFELYKHLLSNLSVQGTDSSQLPQVAKGDVPSLPEHPFRFTTSKLIDYVLKHDFGDDVFELVNRYHPAAEEQVRLQLTEIAINEGSTKAVMEAMIIETVQNSIDAIRSSFAERQVKPEIHLYVKEGADFYLYQITDFVGIPQSGLVSLMIPFLSTKVASQFVTGEMGSGFFNIYRGTTKVIIDTTLNGKSTLVLDTPIMGKDNRVLDLDKHVAEMIDARPNHTSIYAFLPKNNRSLVTSVTDIVDFIKNIVAVIPALVPVPRITIRLNDQELQVKTELLQENASFISFYCLETTFQSYMYTKGVPFLPLLQFVFQANLLPDYMLPFYSTNIVINVKHGVYTPVQTRAKINIDPVNKALLVQFLVDTIYLGALKRIATQIKVLKLDDLNSYLHNFLSGASLNQVLPYRLQTTLRVNDTSDFSHFMMYYRCKDLPNFAHLINESYPIMQSKQWKELTEFEKSGIGSLTTSLPQREVLQSWLTFKNQKMCGEALDLNATTSCSIQTAPKVQVDGRAVIEFTNIFVKHFWNCAKDANISGEFSNMPPPTVQVTVQDRSTKGFYWPALHQLVLNEMYLVDRSENFTNWILTVQEPRDIQKVYNNSTFDDFFKCSYPARTCVHELEHARRGVSHRLEGAHDSVQFQLPGETPKLQTFDEIAVSVFNYIIVNTPFWERVIHDIIQIRNTFL